MTLSPHNAKTRSGKVMEINDDWSPLTCSYPCLAFHATPLGPPLATWYHYKSACNDGISDDRLSIPFGYVAITPSAYCYERKVSSSIPCPCSSRYQLLQLGVVTLVSSLRPSLGKHVGESLSSHDRRDSRSNSTCRIEVIMGLLLRCEQIGVVDLRISRQTFCVGHDLLVVTRRTPYTSIASCRSKLVCFKRIEWQTARILGSLFRSFHPD